MGATSNNMLQLKGIFKDRLFLRIQFSFAPLIQKYNIQNNCSELMQLWGTKQWQTRSMAYLHPDLILHIRAPSLLLLRRKVSKATALRVSITFEFAPFFLSPLSEDRYFSRLVTSRQCQETLHSGILSVQEKKNVCHVASAQGTCCKPASGIQILERRTKWLDSEAKNI